MNYEILMVMDKDGKISQVLVPKISLAAVRTNANLSQSELARMIDVDRTTIINWEKGKTKISSPWLMAFAKACNDFPVDYIFLPFKSTVSRAKE